MGTDSSSNAPWSPTSPRKHRSVAGTGKPCASPAERHSSWRSSWGQAGGLSSLASAELWLRDNFLLTSPNSCLGFMVPQTVYLLKWKALHLIWCPHRHHLQPEAVWLSSLSFAPISALLHSLSLQELPGIFSTSLRPPFPTSKTESISLLTSQLWCADKDTERHTSDVLLWLHWTHVSPGYQFRFPHLPHSLSEPSFPPTGLLLLLAVALSHQGKMLNHCKLNIFVCKMEFEWVL